MSSAADTSPVRRRVEEAFRRRFDAAPELVVRAPGRVNLLGAHVDASEGWVLPGAIDRAVWLAVRPATGARGTLVALDPGAETDLDPSALPPPLGERGSGATAHWADYPRATAWALAADGHDVAAIDGVFAGDIPIGAGVSSSAAVEVAFLLAWRAVGGLDLDRTSLARLGRQAENGYLGVASGPMDQYASLHGVGDSLLLLDCRDLTHETVRFPSDYAILVFDSGVRRALADSAYNDRARETQAACERLRKDRPELRTLRDVEPTDVDSLVDELPPPLDRRARHVVEECARVQAGAAALAAGDLGTLGRLILDSHDSSRNLYEVSIPELDHLVATAAAHPACPGARLSGGGFGGCVVALVESEAADAVATSVVDSFAGRFGRTAPSFVCAIGGGADCQPC